MNNKLLIRKAHRYIGLLVSLQLLAWTLGGIWFTWNDIDDIHGDHLRKSQTEITQDLISPQKAIHAINDFKILKSINVISILDSPVYRINYTTTDLKSSTELVDALTGLIVTEIDQQQAIKIAQSNASFDAEIASIELITETSQHHEYRSKPMPAWAITFEHSGSPTFYVSTKLGTLTSVRHTSWRIFDFFWMLHTMDYEGRDDFGNWLIKIFSLIALVTAISGIVLFFISRRKKITK